MALDSFNVYYSYLEGMEPYSDAECGRLLKACLKYCMTGEVPELPGNERFLFPTWKSQIDRDRKSYEAKCRKNSENVSKRWNTNDTTVYDEIRTYTKHTKDKDKDKDKGEREFSDENSTRKARSISSAFDAFWSEYPRKVGKIAAKKAFERAIRKAPLETLLTAVRRQKCGSQWTQDNGQYIPNPATWLNQGRWEDELPTPQEENTPPPSPAPKRYETRVIDGREVDVEVPEDGG